jgi:hypothetical protein
MVFPQPMPIELKPATEADADLDDARTLVARILEFVVTDEARLRRFLTMTSFKQENARELAESPLFMLSVLDSSIKDEALLRTLQEQEDIDPALIEMTQARLAFHVVAHMGRQTDAADEEDPVRRFSGA